MRQAILHIDGDAFFASCEQSRYPELRGRPVICGKERGIAASMSYEAKNRGVTRAMPIWEIKKLCPDAIFLPSDYETYSLLSQRLYAIVRRYTDTIEEYGIDECFADLTGWDKPLGMSYAQIAAHIQSSLGRELGFSFSCGLSETKTLSKVASKWNKPSGLTIIDTDRRFDFLDRWTVDKIWGVGAAYSEYLLRHHIATAGQFARANEWWIKNARGRPLYDTWCELNGQQRIPLFQSDQPCHSIQKFKTFTPPSDSRDFVFSQLSKNIENACIKARRHDRGARLAIITLRTQSFDHASAEILLPRPTNLPTEVIERARIFFDQLWRPHTKYRATGIALLGLDHSAWQMDLFHSQSRAQKLARVYEGADRVAAKYGKHTLFLGTSFLAHKFGAHLTERGDTPQRVRALLPGESRRRRLGIPMLFAKV